MGHSTPVQRGRECCDPCSSVFTPETLQTLTFALVGSFSNELAEDLLVLAKRTSFLGLVFCDDVSWESPFLLTGLPCLMPTGGKGDFSVVFDPTKTEATKSRGLALIGEGSTKNRLSSRTNGFIKFSRLSLPL